MGKGLALLGMWALFAVVSFVQSIVFTWQSRARNQNDVAFFRKANITAQAVYYIHQTFLAGNIWTAMNQHNLWLLVGTGLVFVVSSNAAAIRTMKWLIANGR